MDPWQIVAVLSTALTAVIGALWKLHLDADSRDRLRGDKLESLLDLSLQNNRDAIAAWDKRNASDAARHRRTD